MSGSGLEIMSARELSRYLQINEKMPYKLVRDTDIPSMRIGGKVAFTKELIDKWIIEKTEWGAKLIVVGCDDDLVRNAVNGYNALGRGLAFYAPMGNSDGLKALSGNRATMACVATTGDTLSLKRYLFEDDYTAVPLFTREQGLLVHKGNPRKIKSLKDIASGDVKFINSIRGSETRVLFDSLLKDAGVDPAAIKGYETEVQLPLHVGQSVHCGDCDTGFGSRNTAEMFGLDHVHLHTDRVFMVIPKHRHRSPDVKAFLAFFETPF